LAALAICAVVASQAVSTGQTKDDKITCQIIYVPTPQPVVDKMIDMAKVTKKDVVYDLGCGDGRIVATVAKKFGARGVGIDIDAERIKDCEKTLKDMEIDAKNTSIVQSNDRADVKKALENPKLVTFIQGDASNPEGLEHATVVLLYMLDEFMEKLEPIAKKRLPKGARIVSHDFRFPNWEADATVEFQGPDRQHTLYLYSVK